MSEPRHATAEVLAPNEPVDPGTPGAQQQQEEPPPFLSTWRNVYLFLAAELGVLVILFYALGRWAS
jgi:hypothetical protein